MTMIHAQWTTCRIKMGGFSKIGAFFQLFAP
jgi:hypothetical protein